MVIFSFMFKKKKNRTPKTTLSKLSIIIVLRSELFKCWPVPGDRQGP